MSIFIDKIIDKIIKTFGGNVYEKQPPKTIKEIKLHRVMMIHGYVQESPTTWTKTYKNYYGEIIISGNINGSVTYNNTIDSTNSYRGNDNSLYEIISYIDKFMNIK